MSLRSRIYNLIEDHVRQTGDGHVTAVVIEKCIRSALKELVDERQTEMF